MSAGAAGAEGLEFDAGVDLRVRQELLENVPGLPNGTLMTKRRTVFKNQMRFRPRVWGEVKGDAGYWGKWRVYTRLADEMRWTPEPYSNTDTFPSELLLDNLYLEGTGVADGLMDVRLGRQDLFNYCGLNHVFVDGTPGDGSRMIYADMAAVRFNVDEDSNVDLFGLYNTDDSDIRWGTDRSKHRSLAARFPNGNGDQDDWGYGAIWSSKLAKALPYQVFAMQKQSLNTAGRYPNHTELIGAKLMPQWSEEWSSDLEAMSELNNQWSGYASLKWKSARQGVKPFGSLGYHYMSGEWDPMWARGVNDSELFLYGTHDGVAWWSNMHYVKLTAGLDFGRCHSLTGSCGPMFAAERDRLGGNDGAFKGFLSQLKYAFPIRLADKSRDERFEVFGHALVEFFNPGDYYQTEKPAWFFRWQVEFRF